MVRLISTSLVGAHDARGDATCEVSARTRGGAQHGGNVHLLHLSSPGVRAAAHLFSSKSSTPLALSMMADGGELSMMAQMSESLWKQKRARMKADLAAQLLELDEFEAREKALQQMAVLQPGSAAGSLGAGTAELQAALEMEMAKSAALQAELDKTRLQAELNLQKVAAFWCARRSTPSRLRCLSATLLFSTRQS